MRENDYFYKIFDVSPIPTVILQGKFPDIVIRDTNEAYAALTGRSTRELAGITFFLKQPHPAMHLDKQGFTEVQQSISEVYQEKTVVKTAVQKFLKPIPESSDFETLYLEATNTPVFAADGEIDFIVRTLQNVTDIILAAKKEKEKDKLLIDNERFLSKSQEVAKIGSWELDRHHQFYWSDILIRIMEVEHGTAITLDFVLALLKKDQDRNIVMEAYRKAVDGAEPFDVELNILTPKGNERWVRFTGKGELQEGQFLKMYGVSQDISAQKFLEQQLLDSSNKLENIIQTVDGIVFECDAHTLEFNFVSEQIEALLGYTPDECIRDPEYLNKLLPPGDKEEMLKLIFSRIHTSKHYSGDHQLLKKDGEVRWMKVSVSVITEDGQPKWLRGLMIDITASKRIYELERIEKQVLELNADASATTVDVLRSYLHGLEFIFPAMKCAIMQVKQGQLHNWVSDTLPAAYLDAMDQISIADNVGSCGTAAFTNETVIVSDIANDPRWADYKQIALKYDLRACWSQPLIDAAGEVIATFAMYYRKVNSPTEEELNVVDRTVKLMQIILQHRHNLELLEEAHLLMEQSQELAHFGSVQYDPATQDLIWSKELYNIFSLDKGSKPTVDFYYKSLHPEDRDRIRSIIQNTLETREEYITEERIIWPNGEVRTLKVWGRVNVNKGDKILKVIATYLDITESKKIQEDLLASESRLRNLVDSQTNYVIRIDFNQNYSYMNSKYVKDFGFKSGESLIGRNSMEFVGPDQRKSIEDVCRKCIAHPNEVFGLELEKYGKDRTLKYSFWHFVCLTNSLGEPTEFQCIGIDISDLKQAEHEREKKAVELEKSEKRYRDLFHLSPQPMWVYDSDSLKFLDVNNAAMEQYGYSRKEFLKMTVTKIMQVEKAVKSRLKLKDFYQGVFAHKCKNGEIIRVDVKRTEIPFKSKIANLTLAINITEPITYLEALEKQNVLLSEIAWIQSHEVRAPLARILGLIDLLENHNNESDEVEFILSAIFSSASELDTIIGDIVRKAAQITVIPGKELLSEKKA